jgi:LacI family transcriptional regulator
VLVGNSDENATREAAYLDLFEQQRVRGVLISPLGDTGPQLQRLRGRGIPSVLVDRQTENSTFSSVAVDDVAGGYLAVSHLVAGGRSRIAFVGGPLVLRQVADRLEGGYRAAAERGSATLEVIETGSLTVTEGRAVGERIRALPPSERPDGIFAANDLLAMGLLQALNMSGDVTVPRDIGLIGYDDIAFASAAVVPLSSIKQPSALIGYTAVDLLLQESDGGDAFEHGQIVFQPELVPRESTATGA